MSIYENLKAKYTDAWKLELQFWEDLESLAQRSRMDFGRYLGVKPNDFATISGQALPVIELGSYLDGKFEACNVKDLPHNGRELEIAFRLNFQLDVNPPKKVQHVFTFGLTKENGSFVAIDQVDFQSKKFPVPEFTDFFKHLTQSI